MLPPDPAPQGFFQSIRTLGDGLLATLQDRVELVSIELREEKIRLVQILIWVGAVMFSAVMALAFASLTLVYLFWESARLAVLGGLALFYGGAAVIIVIAFRRFLARQPRPFAATIEELKGDRA